MEIMNKAHKNSIFFVKDQNFPDPLNDHFNTQKHDLEIIMLKIALLENCQKHVPIRYL